MKEFLRTRLSRFLLLPRLLKILDQLRVQQEHSTTVLSTRCRELEHTVLTLEGRINSLQARVKGLPDRRAVNRADLP